MPDTLDAALDPALDAATVRRWCDGCLAALQAHQQEIDDLNVYPVPDGDTGTNLVLTFTSARAALAAENTPATASPGGALTVMSRGALLGARGNSGVIVAQLLRGLATALTDDDPPAAAADRTSAADGPAPVGAGPDPDGAGLLGGGGGPLSGGAGPVPDGAGPNPDGVGLLGGGGGPLSDGAGPVPGGPLPPHGGVDGPRLARALQVAADAAWAAVAAPVEGTVLSVASAAAAAAAQAVRLTGPPAAGTARHAPDVTIGTSAGPGAGDPPPAGPGTGGAAGPGTGGGAAARGAELVAVARAAARGATDALARTTGQLAQLAAAGVVDAGGRGLCLLLDALVAALTGDPVPGEPASDPAPEGDLPARAVHDADASGYGYEVQYLLEADAAAVERLKAELAGLGDCLVVVGDPPTWNVHVHVDDVGRAIEAGVEAGRPYRISVTRFADQGQPRAEPPAEPRQVDEHRRAVVVMADGEGLARVFAAEGAAVVGANPSTAEVVAAVRGTGAARVVLLPDDRNRHAVAASAAQEAAGHGVRVSVVPTRSPVQALAALAVRDADRAFSQDVIAMADAAGACRYGEVCRATREALTVAGQCCPGDVLGLVDGEVHLIGTDLAAVCRDLLDRMLGGGGELVTLLFGADAPDGLAAELRAHLARRWPFAEINEFTGGQPRFPLLVGVE